MSLCGDVDAAGTRMPLHRFAGTIRRNKHRDDRAHGRLQNPLAQNDVRAGEPSRRWEARWNKWKGQLPIVICKHPVGRVLGEARFEERDGLFQQRCAARPPPSRVPRSHPSAGVFESRPGRVPKCRFGNPSRDPLRIRPCRRTHRRASDTRREAVPTRRGSAIRQSGAWPDR